MTSRCLAQLRLSALKDNYTRMRRVIGSPGAQILPMVKAQAYGHGMVPVVKTLMDEKNLYAFGVATLQEGIFLREQFPRVPLIVFSDFPRREYYDLCCDFNLEWVFHSLEAYEDYLRWTQKSGRCLRYHFKLNTGLNRLGIDSSQWQELSRKAFLSQSSGGARLAKVSSGQLRSIFTHLPSPQNPGVQTMAELRRFREAQGLFPQVNDWHALSTLGLVHKKKYEKIVSTNIFRPGLGLYGYGIEGLSPVMQLKAKVIKVRNITKGDAVGYDRTYRATGNKSIATLGCGYGDGLFRSLSHKLIEGRKVLGRVSMDLFCIDNSKRVQLKEGDWLVLWGKKQDQALQIAKSAGTNVYEILTAVSSRVPRILMSEEL